MPLDLEEGNNKFWMDQRCFNAQSDILFIFQQRFMALLPYA